MSSSAGSAVALTESRANTRPSLDIAGASNATAGYGRAFVMSAVALVIGALLALALPAKRNRQVTVREETARPVGASA